METTLCHVLKLSLKELSLRRVIINLWSDLNVLALIGNFPFRSMRRYKSKEIFQEAFEDEVKIKLLELVVPESLKKQMINLVLPIGSDIRAWKRYHEPYLTDSNGVVALAVWKKLCWTSLGTIDYQKTAKELVNNELVDLVNRYILACLYCMEEKITSIWEKFPEEIKGSFYTKGHLPHVEYPYLPYFWPYILKKEESKLHIFTEMPGFEVASSNQRFFHFAACQGNRAAAEYFFNKLNPFEREECLVKTGQDVISHRATLFADSNDPPMEKHTEVLCYLLSLMTLEQQIKCLKKKPKDSLWCFMDWPWYDLFSEITSHFWTFVTAENYDSVLRFIKYSFITADYLNPTLFQNFFIHCPDFFKERFLHQSIHFFEMLHMLIELDFPEIIQVIFSTVGVDGRAKLVISRHFYSMFETLITRDKWQLVELCIREATLSKENKETLKKTCEEFSAQGNQLSTELKDWERFFKLLDETDTLFPNKRSSEDEITSKAKILCSRNQAHS